MLRRKKLNEYCLNISQLVSLLYLSIKAGLNGKFCSALGMGSRGCIISMPNFPSLKDYAKNAAAFLCTVGDDGLRLKEEILK